MMLPRISGIRKLIPREGLVLVVDLPGERTRATIRKVVNDDAVVCELTSVMMGKAHNYYKGQMVPVRREPGDIDSEVWRVQSERSLRAEELASTMAAETPAPPPEPANAPVAGVEQGSNLSQHQRDDGKRLPAEAGSRRVPVKRAKAPKAKRRSSAK